MQSQKTFVVVAIFAVVALVLTGSASLASPSGQSGEALGDVHVTGTVASRISYQGRLTDGAGNPLNGNYNLEFQLFTQSSGGATASQRSSHTGLQVTNGLFTVGLDVPAASFDGQELWLQIWANGTPLAPRQALLPVPYALGLRPGAVVSSPGPTGLTIDNAAGGYALKGTSQNNIGVLGTSGVATSTAPGGIHGVHGSAAGVGVYGEGGHTGVYGIGDSHGVQGDSTTGDGVLGATTSSAAGSAGVRARNQGGGPAIIAEGDLYVTGAYRGNLGPNQGAPFPRPAYDSGWVTINPAQEKTLTHNLGGNVDNYVVDLQFKATGLPFEIHSIAYGGDLVGSRREGGYYKNLNTSSVIINRFAHDLQANQMRVRIWVYR